MQDRRPDPVVTGVDRKTLHGVGVDRVVAHLLQFVGPQLVGESDPATLVAAQIDEDAAALRGDHLERRVELLAAVAAQRAERVAGQALGVDPDQHVPPVTDLAHDHGHVFGVAEGRPIRGDPEGAEPGRDGRRRRGFEQMIRCAAMRDEVGNRDHVEIVSAGELGEILPPCQRPVVVDDLAEDPDR